MVRPPTGSRRILCPSIMLTTRLPPPKGGRRSRIIKPMAQPSITVPVSAEAARGFKSAPEEKRKLAQAILDALFRPRKPASLSEFRKLAERAGKQARERGLTEEKLKEILDED